jgi:PAS domain S-box-containing protein
MTIEGHANTPADSEVSNQDHVPVRSRNRARQLATVAELAQQALAGMEMDELRQRAAEVVALVLEVEYTKLLKILPDGLSLKVVAGVGWPDGVVGEAVVGIADQSQAGRTLRATEPVVVSDLASEARFQDSSLLEEHDVVSGVSCIIAGEKEPWGILGVHTTRRRHFSPDDVDFVQSVANVVAAATRRAQARLELEKRHQLLAIAERMGHVGGWMIELDDNTVYWSDEVCRIHDAPLGTRVPIEEGINHFAPEWRPTLTEHFRACVEEGRPYDLELEIITRKGRRVWVRTIGEPVRGPDGKVVRVQGAFQDISAQKEAEEALRSSEERFRAVARATSDVVWDWNAHTGELWWGGDTEAVFGHENDEMGQDFNWWAERVHPDDLDRVVEGIQETVEDSDRELYRDEYRLHRADGSWVTVLDRALVIRDDEGRALQLIGGLADITETKVMEAQLLRAQRLESIGTLAGGLAHDLNNVLGPVLMSIELLRMDATDPETLEILETIEQSTTRGAAIIRQVLAFARGVTGERVPVEVAQVVDELRGIVRETFPRNVELEIRLADDLHTLMGDPTQLHQVLLNLALNARDAMPEGGRLLIEAENMAVDHERARALERAGPHVCIRVTDEGTGMPPEVVEQIFDPFFTTKRVGEGTGLGLATVDAIVRSHGGFVDVDTEPGKGTTMEICLPAREAQEESETGGPLFMGAERGKDTAAELPWGDGRRILVVDDEPGIVSIARQTLEAFGYQVETATDGAEALEIYRERGQEVDLILTDLMMPRMDGAALIKAIREMDREVPIVAASGRGSEALWAGSDGAAAAGAHRFIPKPYTAERLLVTVHEVLAATT